MIKTTAEYKEAAEFINRDIELYDFDLGEKMSSYEYNLYLQDIEYYFDFLYEKIRTIEDMIKYLDFYSNEKISKAKKSIDSKLDILVEETSKYIDVNNITCKIEWDINPSTKMLDRDGSNLQVAKVKNGFVSPSGEVYNLSKIKNIYKESNNISFSDNITTCVSDGYYIANYELDSPSEIVEKFYIETDLDVSKINYFNATSFNCKIEPIDDISDNKIKFNLIANKFSKRLENFDYKTYCDLNTNKLDAKEYNFNMSESLNNNQNAYANIIDNDNIKEYLYDITKKISVFNHQIKNSNNITRSLN